MQGDLFLISLEEVSITNQMVGYSSSKLYSEHPGALMILYFNLEPRSTNNLGTYKHSYNYKDPNENNLLDNFGYSFSYSHYKGKFSLLRYQNLGQ